MRYAIKSRIRQRLRFYIEIKVRNSCYRQIVSNLRYHRVTSQKVGAKAQRDGAQHMESYLQAI